MPDRNELRVADPSERAVDQLRAAYEVRPTDYGELLGVDGVGPKSLRALALVAERVHDAGVAREDPAKHAYAHGGKEGTPHPVDRERYDGPSSTCGRRSRARRSTATGGPTRWSASRR